MTSRERIGTRIAYIRKGKGYTVRQLAEMANLRAATISNVENGKFSVGIDILSRICDALGYEVDLIKTE